jgi:hypothetical protein
MDNDSWIDGIIAKLTPISEKMPLIINLIVVLNLALSAAIDLVDLIL